MPELETHLCSSCEREVDENNVYNVNDEIYCESCFYDIYAYCDNCGCIIDRNDILYHNDLCYCERCHSRLFSECNNCGGIFRRGDLIQGLCGECSGNILEHGFKPKTRFFGRVKNDPFFIGFELEVEANRELASKINKDYLYLKEDGSLNNGFEIVSHPVSKKWIYDHKKELYQFFDFLSSNGARSYNTETCGIHLHVSRRALSTLDIFKILKFFYENKTFILKISQRKRENLERWAGMNGHGESLPQKVKNKNDSRYECINLQNDNTIEFRIFRGTLNFDSFMKNIEFVISICDFVKDSSILDVNYYNYKRFIEKTKKYSYLTSFLNKRGL